MIHAGTKFDASAWEYVYDLARKLKASGRWREFRSAPWPLSGTRPNPDADPEGTTPYGAIVGVVTLDEVRKVARGDDPWFNGPIGWYVRDPVPIKPVWCGGSRTLWSPSSAVIDEVKERVTAVLEAERAKQNESLREGNIRCFTCGAQVVSGGFDAHMTLIFRCSAGPCDVVINGIEARHG